MGNPVAWFEIHVDDVALVVDMEGNMIGLHSMQ